MAKKMTAEEQAWRDHCLELPEDQIRFIGKSIPRAPHIALSMIDCDTKRMITPFKFSSYDLIEPDLSIPAEKRPFAIVLQGEFYKVINKLGKEFVHPPYRDIRVVNGRVFLARPFIGRGCFFALIDSTGNELTSYSFSNVISTHSSKILAVENSSEKYGFIDENGREITPFLYDYVKVFANGNFRIQKENKWGIVDEGGKEIVACVYEKIGDISDGLASVQKDGKWGYIDTAGKEIVPCIYESAGNFSGGLASIQKDGKWGYIDTAGKEIVPCLYESADNFTNGVAKVQKDGKWGYVDTTGKEIVPCIYDAVKDFNDDHVFVTKDRKSGCYDISGKEIVPCIYDAIEDFNDDHAFVTKDRKSGCYNISGKEVVPCQYEYLGKIGCGLFRAEKDGLCALINSQGKELTPYIYQRISAFPDKKTSADAHDFITVMRDGKWGFLDINGNEVLPCEYESVGKVSEDAVVVKKDGKYGYVSVHGGTEILPITQDNLSLDFVFKNGFAPIKREGKFGLIDITGKEIIPCIYTDIPISLNSGHIIAYREWKWALFDGQGNQLTDFIYENIACCGKHLLGYNEKYDYCFIDTNGKEISSYFKPSGKAFIGILSRLFWDDFCYTDPDNEKIYDSYYVLDTGRGNYLIIDKND